MDILNNKKGMVLIIGLLIIGCCMIVSADNPITPLFSNTVCCEKTNSGLYCQDVLESECNGSVRKVPTACSSTSYCKSGTCYNSNDGTCTENTPQILCNANQGVWSENKPSQCELGCCVLGDQANFVTLVRCKKLSSFLGLETNYKGGIKDELECIMSVKNKEKGACVYEFEFEKTCKVSAREECTSEKVGGATVTFFAGKLCSAEELGTNCGPSRKTTCIAGRDEVYFMDTCGNPANIYDSAMISDKEYWTNIKSKWESCGFGAGNGNSKSCGNCDYILGSICKEEKGASYGDYICTDLNCKKTSNGKSYKHGESWCVYDDKGPEEKGNYVGSRFYKHICINGEEVLEACEDYRNEICIEDKLVSGGVSFSQAACRVNRWKSCTAQDSEKDCENGDQRDCYWRSTSSDIRDVMGLSLTDNTEGVCLPRYTPGQAFWSGDDKSSVCASANAQCVITYKKGLFGSDWECDEDDDTGDGEESTNCRCDTPTWENEHVAVCRALGDCGGAVNWAGSKGYDAGWTKISKKFKGSSGSGGGLLGF